MDAQTKEALKQLHELLANVKVDAEKVFGKYKFLQLQLDMLNDRLDTLENRVGIEDELEDGEIIIDEDFDL